MTLQLTGPSARLWRNEFIPLVLRSEVQVLVKVPVHMSVSMWLTVVATRNFKVPHYYWTLLKMCAYKILYFIDQSQRTYRTTEAGCFEHLADRTHTYRERLEDKGVA
jgi:hypothetical protein